MVICTTSSEAVERLATSPRDADSGVKFSVLVGRDVLDVLSPVDAVFRVMNAELVLGKGTLAFFVVFHITSFPFCSRSLLAISVIIIPIHFSNIECFVDSFTLAP